jgi:hypothetical protein
VERCSRKAAPPPQGRASRTRGGGIFFELFLLVSSVKFFLSLLHEKREKSQNFFYTLKTAA